ncbi:hypothetical protein S40288_09146 [Stachybotrys chartarum IBT 40288]|nr:hypothetical protein S40288_09146 [Stachybotrys chartarum IBT 40288]
MAHKYRLQAVRLKIFWDMLTSNTGTTFDTRTLSSLSREALEVVRVTLFEISKTLSTYSSLARELDEDYKKYFPQKPLVEESASVLTIELPPDLDDILGPTEEELSAEKYLDGKIEEDLLNEAAEPRPKSKSDGFLRNIFNRDNSQKPQKGTGTSQFAFRDLPKAVAWCFQERELNKSLKDLKEKLDDLDGLGPWLVAKLSLDTKIGRLFESASAFRDYRGHRALQQKATGGQEGIGESPTSWEDMRSYIEKSTNPSHKILIEYKEVGSLPRDAIESERKKAKRYPSQLASLLVSSTVDFFEQTTLGALPFKGFSEDASSHKTHKGRHVFAFDYPEGAVGREPLSLHHLISSRQSDFKISLSGRFQVAKLISRYVGTLNSDGWLHKNIRSHAIKFFFQKTGDKAALDTSAPYLTDFGFSRPVNAYSGLRGFATATNIEFDVYRHPGRFGEPTEIFNKTHDVYSLGVVLLEIGMWKTAKQIYGELVHASFTGGEKPTGQDVREWFIKQAQMELEHRMGASYRDAVVLCLDGEQLLPQLYRPDFAIQFQKDVVQKVDITQLNLSGAEEPPPYNEIDSQ